MTIASVTRRCPRHSDRSVLKQRHVSGIRRNSILKCLGRRSVEMTPRNPFVGDWRRNAGRGGRSEIGCHRRRCINIIAGLLIPECWRADLPGVLLAKVGVAGSSPVSRSLIFQYLRARRLSASGPVCFASLSSAKGCRGFPGGCWLALRCCSWYISSGRYH
jgi:hypothetical protein